MRHFVRALAIVCAVIAMAVYGWRWVFPNDESEIKAVLERIADGVSASEDGGDVGRLARAASLRNEFAADVRVDAGPPFQRITGREAIIGVAARIKSSVGHLELSFPDISVLVDPDRQTATAMVTAEAHFDQGGRRNIDARELEIGFKRLESDWVITAVSLLRAIERID